MKPKCLGLELKRRHGAIVVGLNIFSVILLRPVIIIHWSWPGLGNSVNRWLGDKKICKYLVVPGFEFTTHHKSQNITDSIPNALGVAAKM